MKSVQVSWLGRFPMRKSNDLWRYSGHIGVRSGARMVGYALNNLLTGNGAGYYGQCTGSQGCK